MYEHTQRGYVIVGILAPVTLGIVALLLVADEWEARVVAGATLVTTLVVGALFSSLTVTVGAGELAWRFGPGLFRGSVPLDAVVAAEPTRTSLVSGWGIHLTGRGWLYNVSGRDAVWVRLRGGRQFLLGTDEPARLASAILAARPSPVGG